MKNKNWLVTADGPIGLRFFIGGFYAPNTEIRIYQNKVFYCRFGFPFQSTFFMELAEPVAVDSASLYEVVRPCWIWESNYFMHMYDGIQWALSIRINDTVHESFGSNAYPENFDTIVHEVERLLGKPLKP